MGYNLHITRNTAPDRDDGGISFLEWHQYTQDDPSLRLDGIAEANGPNGEILRITDPGITVWTEHPTATEETGLAWLHHCCGEILVTHPDQEFLAKMLSIASDLDALVIGDDGEQYVKPTDHGIRPAIARIQSSATKPWWKCW